MLQVIDDQPRFVLGVGSPLPEPFAPFCVQLPGQVEQPRGIGAAGENPLSAGVVEVSGAVWGCLSLGHGVYCAAQHLR